MIIIDKLAEIARGLQYPLEEPRVNIWEVKGYHIISSGIHMQDDLQRVYNGIDKCILKGIDNQTPKICMEAVKQNEYELLFVKEQTPEICLVAVKKNPFMIRYVKAENQTSEMCKISVAQDAKYERFVEDKSMLQ